MIALSTLPRAGAAAAPLLIAGILLAVPSNTHERSDAKVAAITRLRVCFSSCPRRECLSS